MLKDLFKKQEKRFEFTHEEVVGNNIKQIFRDRATGVQYLKHVSGATGGIVVLVDQDGKPLLDLAKPLLDKPLLNLNKTDE